jgi:hypothetical protein
VSSTNLNKHLLDKHRITGEPSLSREEIQLKRRTFFDVKRRNKSSTASEQKQKWTLTRDICAWFARDLIPFNKVEGEGFKDFCVKQGLIGEGEQQLPTRTTLSRGALSDLYSTGMNTIKDMLSSSPEHAAMCMDLGMDNHKHLSYNGITYHFIDDS